jgi:hypothetical protein
MISNDLPNGDLIIVDGPKAGQSIVITEIEGNKGQACECIGNYCGNCGPARQLAGYQSTHASELTEFA